VIIGVEGLGSVGLRAARELIETPGVEVLLRSSRPDRLSDAVEALGSRSRPWDDADKSPGTVVLCTAAGGHAAAARSHVLAGRSVVSTSDDPADIDGLLALDAEARAAGITVSVGVAFSPGLSCVLARHAADALDEVTLVRVAMTGAGGPACVDRRRAALESTGREWVDSAWTENPPGPTTELVWFPDPVGPTDCERGALAEPVLLQRALPTASQISARSGRSQVSAVRRLSVSRRRPQTEAVGALRVEVSGWRDGVEETVIYAAVDRPSLAAGTLAAVVATASSAPVGASGLAERSYARALLQELARRGVKAAVYDPSTD